MEGVCRQPADLRHRAAVRPQSLWQARRRRAAEPQLERHGTNWRDGVSDSLKPVTVAGPNAAPHHVPTPKLPSVSNSAPLHNEDI
jgi:hypothetical protein